MTRPPPRLACLAAALAASLVPAGCSDRPRPPGGAAARRAGDVRAIKFAGEVVFVPFRAGLPAAPVPDPAGGEVPKPGDRVVLCDFGDGEVEIFLALDLDALKFYHSTPGPKELGRFRLLGDEGRLFVVPRGTVGTAARVVDGELPQGLKAIELELAGESGGKAWVADPFVRRVPARAR